MAEDDVTFEKSERGFKYLEPIVCTYGSRVAVSESSAAMRPCIWLRVEQGAEALPGGLEPSRAVAHLTVEQAEELAKQLGWLVENHYHFEPAEEGAPAETVFDLLDRALALAEADLAASGWEAGEKPNPSWWDYRAAAESIASAKRAIERAQRRDRAKVES